jgi:pectate lyase
MIKHVFTIILIAFLPSAQAALLPAFPGAEGFGAAATGGRGGRVIRVTNLNDSGAGSLQAALNQSGPRIIVFDVSGVIYGDVRVPHGDVTIAGQTAPGAGITIYGHMYTDYPTRFGNIIIRHIRVRPPLPDSDWPPAQHDGIQFSANHLMIYDHIDISHAVDENLDMYHGARDITVQWSVISLSVMGGGHPDGPKHNYGLINGPGGGRISVHHNLFAHNKNRNPALSNGPADVINNVVYNSREGFVHNNPVAGQFNIVGNFYKDGPSAELAPLWFDPENNNPNPSYYVFDNYVDDPGGFVGRLDNPYTTHGFNRKYYFECCGIQKSMFNRQGMFDFSKVSGYTPVTVDPPKLAYDRVLNQAGAWPRDSVTKWAVQETRDRNGNWGNRRPDDWLEGLTPGKPLVDTDGDGMPNIWECANGLNPQQNDSTVVRPSGYTAMEDYINELSDALINNSVPPGLNSTKTCKK